MIPMDSRKPHLSPFHQSLILWSAGVTRNKFSQFQRFTVKSPETRVMLPEIRIHVAQNPKSCRPKFYRVFKLEEKQHLE